MGIITPPSISAYCTCMAVTPVKEIDASIPEEHCDFDDVPAALSAIASTTPCVSNQILCVSKDLSTKCLGLAQYALILSLHAQHVVRLYVQDMSLDSLRKPYDS